MKPIWPGLFVLIVIGLWVTCWIYGWHSWVKEFWIGSYPKAEFADKMMGCFVVAVTTLLAGGIAVGAAVLGCLLAECIGYSRAKVWHQCWSSPLVSMRNSDGETGTIRGGIFMIAGNIDQSSVYFYYVPTSDGGFRQKKWKPNDDTTIYEEDRKDGEVVQFDTAFKNDWDSWIAMPNDRVRMDFHIPKGAIQRNFNLK